MKFTIFFIIQLVILGSASATQCRLDGGPNIPIEAGQNVTTDIRVNVTPSDDTSSIRLDGYKLECKYAYDHTGHVDYMDTTDEGFVFGPKFSKSKGGLEIKGSHYATPIPNKTRIASLPSNNNRPPWVNLNTYAYINKLGEPWENITIFAGDVIGTVKMVLTNNYDDALSIWNVNFIANNDLIIRPSTCSINNGSAINVDFGMVESQLIANSPSLALNKKTVSLSYSCPEPGLSLGIKISFNGQATNFNNSYLAMSNEDLGIALEYKGQGVNVGEGFLTSLDNSTGNDEITFSLVKKTGSNPKAGPVSAVGVLELTLP